MMLLLDGSDASLPFPFQLVKSESNLSINKPPTDLDATSSESAKPASNSSTRKNVLHSIISRCLNTYPRPMMIMPTIAGRGRLVLIAAGLGYVGTKLRSEAVNRAMYFWVNAGPIIAHYKFTRWYLGKTKAPLERRDQVYNKLHEKYCGKSMEIALHLKGTLLT